MTEPTSYVIDTHALLWFLSASRRLSARAKKLMQDAEKTHASILIIPAMVLVEAITLIERQRVTSTVEDVLAVVGQDPYQVVPINMQVIGELRQLPASLEIHDRLIAATARLYGAKVVTRDPQLTGAVETFW